MDKKHKFSYSKLNKGNLDKLNEMAEFVWEAKALVDSGGAGGQGEKGDTGDTGPKGDKGLKGDKGVKGESGSNGTDGTSGVSQEDFDALDIVVADLVARVVALEGA